MFGHGLRFLLHLIHGNRRHDQECTVRCRTEQAYDAGHSRDRIEILEVRVHDIFC